MVKLFLDLYQTLSAHRRVVCAALLLVVLGAVALALRVDYEEDIARFLPQNEQNARYSEVYQGLSAQGRIVVLFSGHDTDSIEQALDCFEAQLSQLDEQHVADGFQARVDENRLLEVVDFILANIPYFMTADDWRRADSLLSQPGYVARQMEDNKRLLQLPMGGSATAALRSDPLHLFGPVVQRLQSLRLSDQFQMVDGCVFTRDGQTALAFLDSPYGVSESMHNNELSRLLDAAIAQTQAACAHVSITAVGAPLIAVGNANQIKHDSLLAVALAVTLILLLLVFHYRRLADLLWIAASIAFGWLFAIAGMSLFADDVSIIVLGIGSVIIGIAVNYPLHYLDHLQHTVDRRQTLRDMVPPLLIGNITTVSAFLCLVWLDAAAMRSLGVFGSLVLIGTILFVLVFLPLYAKAGAARRSRLHLNLDFLQLRTPRSRLLFLGVVTVLTLVFGWLSLHTSFDADIRHINYVTPRQQQCLDLLAQSADNASVYVVAQGPDLESALQQSERVVEPALQSLQQGGVVTGYSSLSRFLPSVSAQQELTAQWNDFWSSRRDVVLSQLLSEAQRHGFVAEAFAPFVSLVSTPAVPQPASYFQPLTDLLSAGFVQQSAATTRLVSYVRTQRPDAVKSLVARSAAGNDAVFAFAPSDIGSQLVQVLSDSFNYIGFVCGFVVFFFLWVSFGRLELSLLSFLPLAVSWVWILGAMQLFGVQFNIVNIILATFIFGQGDDYTIFITEGLVAEYATGRRRLDSYKRSVALSAVIMFIGIGTLILARHPALRSLAQVTIIGMFTVVLMAFYLPPLVFHWLTRRADGSLRQVPLTLRRLSASLFSLLFFLAMMYLFLLPFTWLWFHVGRITESRRLRYHRLLQRVSAFVIRHVPGVGFHLDNAVGETFQRPAVIVSNHQSHLDLMCLMMLTPRIVFLTNDWVWHNPFYGAVVHHAEFLPVSDGIERNIDPLRRLYERGYSICVFPEGTRSEDCRILRFHQGAFYLARQLGADVLPVYLHGVGHVLPKRDFMLRQGRVDVMVGRRLPVDDALFQGTLLEATKSFRRYYRQHYDALCRRIETPAYYVPFVRYQYLYKGLDVERRSRALLRQALSELSTESYPLSGPVSLVERGQGEKSLLLALTHPDVQVTATVADPDDFAVATHLSAIPSNLHFQSL